MLTLRDLMTPKPKTLAPEMTLREAIEELSHWGVSGAPVVAGDRLLGVLSSGDILDFESSNPGVPAHRPDHQEWGEIGSADLLSEDVSDPPAAYFQDLWADSGADVVERIGEGKSPEWDFLSEHIVGEVMTRKVHAFPPETGAAQAARLMVERKIHRLLVIENETLAGIVSTMDFVRAVAEERLR
jgi:CBS domain-containing protein